MTRNQGCNGDLVEADRYQLDELRAAAFGESAVLSRQLALALLGRKRYPKKADDFGRLLASENEEPRLRIMAATELGRMGTQPAIEQLAAALNTKEQRVLQSVVEATAAAGGAESLSRVRVLRRRKLKSLAEAAEWGSELLALRSGERTRPLTPPAERSMMSIDEKRADPVKPRKLADDAAETIVSEVAAGSLKLDLSSQSAVRARCGTRDFALLFTRSFLEDMPAALGRRTIALAVAELHQTEHRSWDVRYLVVAQPSRGGIELHALTRSGQLAFFGHATIDDDGLVEFSLRTVDKPGAAPVVISGTFAGDRLRFERFDAEPTGRRRVSAEIHERARR